jgi:RHS repeat-associated protein
VTGNGPASQYADPETGYQYLRARYYDPTTAQFLSRDPAVALTLSAYGYVNNNPLNGADPAGLRPWWNTAISAAKSAARVAINNGALSGGIGPDQVAAVYGEITSGGNCHLRGTRLECDGAASPLNGNPFTVGDVVLNPGSAPLNNTVFGHESRHSNQWAVFGGWGFLVPYGLDYLIEGRCNSFERSAGYTAGGYTDCGSSSSSASALAAGCENFTNLFADLPGGP